MYGINRSELVFEVTCYDLVAFIAAKFQAIVPIAASETSEAWLVKHTSKNLFYYRLLGLPISWQSRNSKYIHTFLIVANYRQKIDIHPVQTPISLLNFSYTDK